MLTIRIISYPKDDPTVALRQDSGFDLAWSLRDKQQPNSIFTAFLSNPSDCLLRGFVLGFATVWDIAVRFFANQQYGIALTLITSLPDLKIEQSASNHRTANPGHFVRHPRQIHNPHWLAVANKLREDWYKLIRREL